MGETKPACGHLLLQTRKCERRPRHSSAAADSFREMRAALLACLVGLLQVPPLPRVAGFAPTPSARWHGLPIWRKRFVKCSRRWEWKSSMPMKSLPPLPLMVSTWTLRHIRQSENTSGRPCNGFCHNLPTEHLLACKKLTKCSLPDCAEHHSGQAADRSPSGSPCAACQRHGKPYDSGHPKSP